MYFLEMPDKYIGYILDADTDLMSKEELLGWAEEVQYMVDDSIVDDDEENNE